MAVGVNRTVMVSVFDRTDVQDWGCRSLFGSGQHESTERSGGLAENDGIIPMSEATWSQAASRGSHDRETTQDEILRSIYAT